MKKLILAALMVAFVSCNQEPAKKLEYDNTPVIIEQNVTVKPGDVYMQKIEVPTRGLKAGVEIINDSDTARNFIVNVKEVK